jgi:hypothetical protein
MGVPFFAMHDSVRPPDAFADCVGIAGVESTATARGAAGR